MTMMASSSGSPGAGFCDCYPPAEHTIPMSCSPAEVRLLQRIRMLVKSDGPKAVLLLLDPLRLATFNRIEFLMRNSDPVGRDPPQKRVL